MPVREIYKQPSTGTRNKQLAHAERGGVDVFEPESPRDCLQRSLFLRAGDSVKGQVVQRAKIENYDI